MCGCRKGIPGTVPAKPLILGEDDENLPTFKVQMLITASGARVGAIRWVRGTSVQTMIDNEQLKVVG